MFGFGWTHSEISVLPYIERLSYAFKPPGILFLLTVGPFPPHLEEFRQHSVFWGVEGVKQFNSDLDYLGHRMFLAPSLFLLIKLIGLFNEKYHKGRPMLLLLSYYKTYIATNTMFFSFYYRIYIKYNTSDHHPMSIITFVFVLFLTHIFSMFSAN